MCNGGLAVGALAIADEEPELATSIISSGLKATRGAFAHWDADGGWDEGPGYWGYTTQYTSYYLAALASATGSTFGLAETPGLDKAGYFRMYFIGPTGRTFNFADAGDKAGSDPQMFFLSQLYNHPEFAWQHRHERLESPFDLLWYDARGTDPKEMKLDQLFRGTNVLFLRSAWNDPKAMWGGVKGGNNAANHSHLDLGTFVIDALGKRWASDLGGDDYNMPGYFGNKRWTYYRLMTQGHNTLLINGENQPPKAQAALKTFEGSDGGLGAIIDLTAAYPAAKSVKRGLRMYRSEGLRNTILVQDEVEADPPVTMVSALHTAASVTLADDGRSATLKIDDQQMSLMLLGDPTTKLTVTAVKLDPPQEELKGITRIQVEFPGKVGHATVGLLLSPGKRAWPELEPIARWRDYHVEQ